jgi:hypothetical protein
MWNEGRRFDAENIEIRPLACNLLAEKCDQLDATDRYTPQHIGFV